MSQTPQPRQYFSERQGRGPKAAPLPIESIRKLVVSAFDSFQERGYMQEAFGIQCVDGDSEGSLGWNPDGHFTRATLRENIWPYRQERVIQEFDGPRRIVNWEAWDADTLFDVIEVMHDLISKPLDGTYHAFSECGWHYETFNQLEGQVEFREEMNQILQLNDPPYKLDDQGQIVELGEPEFDQLLDAPVPAGTDEDLITSKVTAAVSGFRSRGATVDDRRHAVRDLADVLEAIRSDVRESMLTADEKALFNLANSFAIRHNNRDQRGDYEQVTWLRWAFYVYLATIHAVLRVRDRDISIEHSGSPRKRSQATS